MREGSPRPMPRLVSSLHPMEQKAVLTFTEQLVRDHSPRVATISLYSTGQRTSRGFEDIEILVLTPKDDGMLENAILDLIAEIVVDTGVYLTVKCLSRKQFQAFKRAGLPFIKQVMARQIALFQA